MKTKIISDFTLSDNFIRDTISLYNKLHTYVRESELYKVFDVEQIEILDNLDAILKKVLYDREAERVDRINLKNN